MKRKLKKLPTFARFASAPSRQSHASSQPRAVVSNVKRPFYARKYSTFDWCFPCCLPTFGFPFSIGQSPERSQKLVLEGLKKKIQKKIQKHIDKRIPKRSLRFRRSEITILRKISLISLTLAPLCLLELSRRCFGQGLLAVGLHSTCITVYH